MTMVNNVIGVVNYVIAPAPSLLNFVIADTWCAAAREPQRRPVSSPPRDRAGSSKAGCDTGAVVPPVVVTSVTKG